MVSGAPRSQQILVVDRTDSLSGMTEIEWMPNLSCCTACSTNYPAEHHVGIIYITDRAQTLVFRAVRWHESYLSILPLSMRAWMVTQEN